MFYSRVFNRQTGEIIGYLGDLSAQGMMVIAEHPLDANEQFEISMDLPEEIYARPSLNFSVQSIWCKPDLDPAFFTIGFKLLNPVPEDVRIVHRILNDYGLIKS